MKALRCSEEDALSVIEADKRIDRGEKLFELVPELQAGAKKHDKQTANLVRPIGCAKQITRNAI